jgi:hypothetical protein
MLNTLIKEFSMNDLLSDFKQNMAIKDYSESTQKSYSYMIKLYLSYCQEHNKGVNSESFKQYLFEKTQNNKLSTATLKQNIGAVKFFLSTPSASPMI